MARSNLVQHAFVWENGKTMDFSETIIVYDIKVGICSELNKNMNPYEYQKSMSFSNFFSLEPARLIEAKFHVQPMTLNSWSAALVNPVLARLFK